MKTWLFITIIIFLFSAPVVAAPLSPALLLDTICFYETRAEPNPSDALGESGEIGECQVRPQSARMVGARGSNQQLITNLFRYNRYWAAAVLAACIARPNWRIIKLHGYAFAAAYCYNGGPYRAYHRGSAWYRYAKQIATAYAEALKSKEFPYATSSP